MSAGLGIRIGTVTSVAALDTSHDPYAPRDAADDEATTTVTRRSALDLRSDEPALASPRDRDRLHLIGGFADRVGDPVPIVDEDGSSYLAEDLYATATRALVAEITAGSDAAPAVVVTHPDRWSSYTADAVRESLTRAGVPDATLVPESFASMRWLEATRGTQHDGLTVIYDLGATSLDITLMRTGAESGPIGSGVHSQDFGGAQFDHLITQHVLETVSSTESFEFDPFDPDTVGALVELRSRCGEAKEQLSYETATTLTVDLPGLHTDSRLVRDEVEELVRQPILDSVELIRETLHTAGLDASDVTQVLLTGGGSAIPLVAELISSELRVPVVAGSHPDRIPAIGGSLIAAEIAQTIVADAPPPAPVDVTRPAPRSAPMSATASAAESSGMSRRKKAGLVVGTVVALAVLAGGGLSVGTALTSNDKPAVSENTADTTSTTSAPGTTVAPIADTGVATTENGLPAPTVAADGTLIPAPGTTIAADGTVVADPTAAPVVDGAAPPAAPAAPSVQVPNVPVPNPSAPTASVPSVSVPRPQAPTYSGPTVGDVGRGVGGAVNDIGEGAGGLVGGVVGGVGGLVGGVTGPLLGN